MDAALYDPQFGYYARAARQSGRAGDFFTSVDVGPLFGQLLARQIAEMAEVLADLKVGTTTATHPTEVVQTLRSASEPATLDLVEAGAGNGRLSADILRTMQAEYPDEYARTALQLIETSAAARAAQRDVLGPVADRLAFSDRTLPVSFEGVLLANELLDAMPVHQIVMREEGLREIYVQNVNGALTTTEGPLSTSRLWEYFDGLGITLEPGWQAEVSLAAIDWVRDALRRLKRGFVIFIDYGHEAAELYSVAHSAGTLTSFTRHTSAGADMPSASWLQRPGEQDLTAHVDFTSIRRAAEREGATVLGFLDQMYFLMALVADRLDRLDLKERLALKTLIVPGGLGSTMKVLILGKEVGVPPLLGCSSHARVT